MIRDLLLALPVLLALGFSLSASGEPPLGHGRELPPPIDPDAPRELIIEDIKVGEGNEITLGSWISVHYTGSLLNGEKFDSSRDPGREPFELFFPGQIIPGWNQGLLGMKVGGVRKLTIPSHLGYGMKGSAPKIPGNAALVFEIECLAVENGSHNIEMPSGFKIETIKEGEGEPAAFGQFLAAELTMKLAENDTVIFSTRNDTETTLELALPASPLRIKEGRVVMVIPELGGVLLGIKPGEQRKVTLPGNRAFGVRGVPELNIPANAAIIYEIECARVYSGQTIELGNGMKIQDIRVGEGTAAETGHMVQVHYVGRLTDGTIFDQNQSGQEPFTFMLGRGTVIEGWDLGVQGMKPGGIRLLTIPAALAYGDRGAGGKIKPGDTLVFEVTLVSTGLPPR